MCQPRSKALIFLSMLVVSVSLCCLPSHAEASEVEITMLDAINIAGRQRMLTQRMMKLYCLVGMNVNAARNQEEILSATDLFDKGGLKV